MGSLWCDDCGEPLDVTRSDAKFCSGACRQRAYRRREHILKRYGSWENALSSIIKKPFWSVTDSSRNAESGQP